MPHLMRDGGEVVQHPHANGLGTGLENAERALAVTLQANGNVEGLAEILANVRQRHGLGGGRGRGAFDLTRERGLFDGGKRAAQRALILVRKFCRGFRVCGGLLLLLGDALEVGAAFAGEVQILALAAEDVALLLHAAEFWRRGSFCLRHKIPTRRGLQTAFVDGQGRARAHALGAESAAVLQFHENSFAVLVELDLLHAHLLAFERELVAFNERAAVDGLGRAPLVRLLRLLEFHQLLFLALEQVPLAGLVGAGIDARARRALDGLDQLAIGLEGAMQSAAVQAAQDVIGKTFAIVGKEFPGRAGGAIAFDEFAGGGEIELAAVMRLDVVDDVGRAVFGGAGFALRARRFRRSARLRRHSRACSLVFAGDSCLSIRTLG